MSHFENGLLFLDVSLSDFFLAKTTYLHLIIRYHTYANGLLLSLEIFTLYLFLSWYHEKENNCWLSTLRQITGNRDTCNKQIDMWLKSNIFNVYPYPCIPRLSILSEWLFVSSICGQRRPRSACASAQTDQGLRCPLTESLDTTECINGEQIPGCVGWLSRIFAFCVWKTHFRLARPI